MSLKICGLSGCSPWTYASLKLLLKKNLFYNPTLREKKSNIRRFILHHDFSGNNADVAIYAE